MCDKTGCLYNRRSDSRAEYSILEELEHKMSVNRKTESKILFGGFVDKLKEMLEEIENAINTFKDEQRQIYEQLLKDEKTAVNELSIFEKKVELWARSSSTTEKVLKLPSARISVNKTLENHLPKEVVEFERFLQQTGGRRGGWDDCDHQNFLKVWTKHRGRLSYVDEALEYLCGRTKEDVKQHGMWYREFLMLQDRKKESIKKWKEKQQREKEENLKKKEKSEKIVQRLQYEEDQMQRAEERRRQQAAISAWKKQKAVASCNGTSITARTRGREGEKETKRMPAPMPHEGTGGKEYLAEERGEGA
uniref:Coiled-coil domain containing 112 n=1 Tax=Pavo cristatus TaxID=9049 RepID=A0A8C9L768_PAVCR